MEETSQTSDTICSKICDWAIDFWNYEYSAHILIALACIFVLFLIYRAIRKRYAPIKLFNNTAGTVSVTPAALSQLVESVCYSMGALNRPDVKIYTKRSRLFMIVSLKLEAGQKLSETSTALQEELTNACREQLGVEKLGRIDVKIKGFKGILKKPSKPFNPLESVEETKSEDNSNMPFSSI